MAMFVRLRFRVACLTALVACLAASAASAQSGPVSVKPGATRARTLVAIVNRGRPETSITHDLLVRIFRGETRYWPANRELIQLALPPGSPEAREEFIRSVLKMTPTEYQREWRARRFRGESALIPNPELSRTEVMQAVASQRHFIAIVELDWLRSIDARFTQDVKILSIDGKAPDDSTYPLRFGFVDGPQQFALHSTARLAL